MKNKFSLLFFVAIFISTTQVFGMLTREKRAELKKERKELFKKYQESITEYHQECHKYKTKKYQDEIAPIKEAMDNIDKQLKPSLKKGLGIALSAVTICSLAALVLAQRAYLQELSDTSLHEHCGYIHQSKEDVSQCVHNTATAVRKKQIAGLSCFCVCFIFPMLVILLERLGIPIF